MKTSAPWLREGAWRDHAPTAKPAAKAGDIVDLYAGMIESGKRIFGGVSDPVRSALIQRGYTAEQIDNALVTA